MMLKNDETVNGRQGIAEKIKKGQRASFQQFTWASLDRTYFYRN